MIKGCPVDEKMKGTDRTQDQLSRYGLSSPTRMKGSP